MTPSTLPDLLKVNQNEIKGTHNIADAFNKHFINAGLATLSNLPVDGKDSVATTLSCPGNNFSPISPTQVYKALSSLDCKKSAGPDQTEPYFF